MSLYIAGAISMHAPMQEGDWKTFDSLERSMEKIADKHNVFIGRYRVDDAQHFVISNDSLNFNCFYEGEAFEYDMSVALDSDFEVLAEAFIKELNTLPEFAAFHNLEWSDAARRYYVIS